MRTTNMLTSPPPPSSSLSRLPLENQSVNNNNNKSSSTAVLMTPPSASKKEQQSQQQQSSGTASIVEVTALRFDVERSRAVIEQKSKHIHRLEIENSRLSEQLDNIRSLESDRHTNNESKLLTEIDSLKRTVRVTKDDKVALEFTKESLTQKLETCERRINVLRQFEETNELLHKDMSLKDTEISKLRRELQLSEKKLQEATQQSLCNVLQGKVNALEAMVDDRDNAVNELREHCADLEASLADTRDENAEMKDRCEQMERLMSEMRVAMTGLKSDLAANEKLVDSQYADSSRRQEELQEAKGHVEDRCLLLEELNSELRGEAREANRRAQDREFVITELQNELNVTRQELQSSRHTAQCAEEDERAAIDRMKKIQQLSGDREAELAKQHLLEQSLRSELESYKNAVVAARSDADRLRHEMNESGRRADLLSHQAAQREGAEERVRQLERQLQRTIEENDALRENVANSRRREIDAETVLAKQREQLARIDRLQSELEEREARIAGLRREKQLADAEIDALRQDLARSRASMNNNNSSSSLRPQVSPTRTKLVKVHSPSSPNVADTTSYAFGRHSTPPPTQVSPIKRGISPRGSNNTPVPVAAIRSSPSRSSFLTSNNGPNSTLLTSKRNLANANSSRSIISATVLTPERPYVGGSGSSSNSRQHVGPRQM